MHNYIAFTREGNDPLFLGLCSSDLAHINFSQEHFKKIWDMAFDHFETMISFCPEFCKKFREDDVIDITRPATSFYNVVLVRICWKGTFPDQLAEKVSELLGQEMNPEEIIVFNTFINSMIACQRTDPVADMQS